MGVKYGFFPEKNIGYKFSEKYLELVIMQIT
jgi:hypothetical protein